MENIKLKDKFFQKYIQNAVIQTEIRRVAAEIQQQYRDKNPLCIGVLNGCFRFTADLAQALDIDCQISFVKAASYQGTTSTGNVQMMWGLDQTIENQHIIILEDIVDTGLTIKTLKETLVEQKPASIRIAALLFKPDCLQHAEAKPDFVGFEIPNAFVVGYGLDYDGYGRALNDLYVVQDF